MLLVEEMGEAERMGTVKTQKQLQGQRRLVAGVHEHPFRRQAEGQHGRHSDPSQWPGRRGIKIMSGGREECGLWSASMQLLESNSILFHWHERPQQDTSGGLTARGQ